MATLSWFSRREARPAKVDPELADWQLTDSRILWLTFAIMLVITPHVAQLPIWISLSCAAFLGYRLMTVFAGWTTPHRNITQILCLAALGAVGLSMGTLLGRDAGVALLALLVSLKLLELHGPRDAFIATFLGFFLVLTNFLYSQSLLTGVYMIAAVIALTASMWVLQAEPEDATPKHAFGNALHLLALATPLAIALFVLFPRLPGPLWKLPSDSHRGVSGLSSTMSPGSFSELSQSDKLAFRVYFDNALPPVNDRYWRGPVLATTDGRTWRRARQRDIGAQPIITRRGRAIRYEVEIEPHDERWLFALDVPSRAPPGVRLRPDLELRSFRPIRKTMRYAVTSHTSYRLSSRDQSPAPIYLQLPDGRHPRARALANEWERQAKTPAQRLEAAMEWFRSQPFTYTLRPPRLLNDPVDEFLFETQRGFCEHFASAFTVLMRAAGLPARVVTGYQGGELNPLGGHLIVRQRDAHAWTEVWLPERGWVRIDPTAVVAPQRVERGSDFSFASQGQSGAIQNTRSGGLQQIWQDASYALDYLDSTWNRWVLAYGRNQQAQLLGWLGIDSRDLKQLGLLIIAAILLTLSFAAWWLTRTTRERDPIRRAQAQLERKLARFGVERQPSEGPRGFAARLTREHPQVAELAAEPLRHLQALKFAPTTDPEHKARLRQLQNLIRAIPTSRRIAPTPAPPHLD